MKKRVGIIATLALGFAGLFASSATAQECRRDYYPPQPYAYGYYPPASGYVYHGGGYYYGRDWREARRDREWREYEERRRAYSERWNREHWRERRDWR